MGYACKEICDSQGIESFTISISREEGVPLGIEFDATDGYSVRLTKIELWGSFAKWNKRNCTEQVVRGDHIVAVNGVRGTASGILQRMQRALELEIELHRPATYSIQITKHPDGLGIETRQAQNSRSLMVSHLVGKGAVKDWNDSDQDRQVRRHDRIVKVNGWAGTVEELTQKIMVGKAIGMLGLTLTSAPPKGTERPAQARARIAPGDVPGGGTHALIPATNENEAGQIPAMSVTWSGKTD
jgi:hypothetical protein